MSLPACVRLGPALCALCWALVCAPALGAAPAEQQAQAVDIAPFGVVHIVRPDGAPKSVVLFLEGDGGWEPRILPMIDALKDEGALVASVGTLGYLSALAQAGKSCASPAIDFEALSHRIQKQFGVRQYLPPILVGYSSGATVAYATLVQSPPGTFAGAISLGFCPDQEMKGVKLCRGAGLRYSTNESGVVTFQPAAGLKDPWIVLQGQRDQVCNPRGVDEFGAASRGEVVRLPNVGHGFEEVRDWAPQLRSAYRKLANAAAPAAVQAESVRDLPLVEVSVQGSRSPQRTTDLFAVLLTGDGGWAGIDRDISAELAANGLPVVGFNTLRYFWNARTPEETAHDVARVIQHYTRAWSRPRVVLVGYSLGADVMPFVVNRLPADARNRIAEVALVGPSEFAQFEIHVSGWLPGVSKGGAAVAPELRRMNLAQVLCLYGAGENDSPCPTLAGSGAHVQQIGSGHHLGGRYREIAQQILQMNAPARR